jgi:hypothetical protein
MQELCIDAPAGRETQQQKRGANMDGRTDSQKDTRVSLSRVRPEAA